MVLRVCFLPSGARLAARLYRYQQQGYSRARRRSAIATNSSLGRSYLRTPPPEPAWTKSAGHWHRRAGALYAFAFFAFGGPMASLAALATRNFTTFFAAILIVSPVA